MWPIIYVILTVTSLPASGVAWSGEGGLPWATRTFPSLVVVVAPAPGSFPSLWEGGTPVMLGWRGAINPALRGSKRSGYGTVTTSSVVSHEIAVAFNIHAEIVVFFLNRLPKKLNREQNYTYWWTLVGYTANSTRRIHGDEHSRDTRRSALVGYTAKSTRTIRCEEHSYDTRRRRMLWTSDFFFFLSSVRFNQCPWLVCLNTHSVRSKYWTTGSVRRPAVQRPVDAQSQPLVCMPPNPP